MRMGSRRKVKIREKEEICESVRFEALRVLLCQEGEDLISKQKDFSHFFFFALELELSGFAIYQSGNPSLSNSQQYKKWSHSLTDTTSRQD